MKKPQPPDPKAPPLDGDPAHNDPYWHESQRTAEMKVNDGGGPVLTPWITAAEEWVPPTVVAGLSEHAHHPARVMFGYEAPGGQR